MSHTTELPNGYVAIHDGDLWDCGEIILRKRAAHGLQADEDIIIPYNPVFALVMEHIRQVKIAKLEKAGVHELVELLL